jgi:hypothetical protein
VEDAGLYSRLWYLWRRILTCLVPQVNAKERTGSRLRILSKLRRYLTSTFEFVLATNISCLKRTHSGFHCDNWCVRRFAGGFQGHRTISGDVFRPSPHLDGVLEFGLIFCRWFWADNYLVFATPNGDSSCFRLSEQRLQAFSGMRKMFYFRQCLGTLTWMSNICWATLRRCLGVLQTLYQPELTWNIQRNAFFTEIKSRPTEGQRYLMFDFKIRTTSAFENSNHSTNSTGWHEA